MKTMVEIAETVDQEAFRIIHLAESVLKDKRSREAITGLVGTALAHRNREMLTFAEKQIGDLLRLEKNREVNSEQKLSPKESATRENLLRIGHSITGRIELVLNFLASGEPGVPTDYLGLHFSFILRLTSEADRLIQLLSEEQANVTS